MTNKVRTLVVGCGHMGTSHARAYHRMSDDFEIVGLVSRNAASRGKLNAEFGGGYAEFSDYAEALSRTRPFVKDVVGPKGCVSIAAKGAAGAGKSSDVDSHSKTESLLLHHAQRGPGGAFEKQDEVIDVSDEPDHDELCRREQEVFLRAIRDDADLTDHLQSAIDSLRIVLAADQSMREGRTVEL